jgi:hypothetical protein
MPWGTTEHVALHAPQFDTSVFVFASHPSEGFALQSEYPVEHAIEHFPAEQLGVPPFVLHLAPHAPQFSTSEATLDSHPVSCSLSQSANPVAHVSEHCPAEHCGVAFTVEHAFVQLPQCATSTAVLASQPVA